MAHLVTVFVSSTETYSERRLPPHLTIGELKASSDSYLTPCSSHRCLLRRRSSLPSLAFRLALRGSRCGFPVLRRVSCSRTTLERLPLMAFKRARQLM